MKPDKENRTISDFVEFVRSVLSDHRLFKNSDDALIKEICGYISQQDDANRIRITRFLVEELLWNKFGLKPYSLPTLQGLDFPVDGGVRSQIVSVYTSTLFNDQNYRDQAMSTMLILGISEARALCLEYIENRLATEGFNAVFHHIVLLLNVDQDEGARYLAHYLPATYSKPLELLGLKDEPALVFLVYWCMRFNNGALERVIHAIRIQDVEASEEVISNMRYVLCRRPFNVQYCDYFFRAMQPI
ncbi:MAG: hypothetical protein ABI432_16260 [Flavobacteriales bacterium]